MKIWTLHELLSLTRLELFALYAEIANDTRGLPEDCDEYRVALHHLQLIRAALAARDCRPG